MDSMEKRPARKIDAEKAVDKAAIPTSEADLRQRRFEEGQDFWTAVNEGEDFIRETEKFDNPNKRIN